MRPHLPVLAGVSLALAGAAPAVAAPVPIYGGHTSQDAPIALRTSADGRTLTQLLVHVDMKCDDGTHASWSGAATFAAFKPPDDLGRGRTSSRRPGWRRSGKLPRHRRGDGVLRRRRDRHDQGDAPRQRPPRRRARHVLGDARNRRRADRAEDRVVPQRHAALGGTERARARLRGADVRRSADRGAALARRAHASTPSGSSWGAACQSGSFFDVGEQFVRFPVSRSGRFGNAFDQPFTLDGGGTADLRVPAQRPGGGEPRLGHLPRGGHREGRGRRHDRQL